MGSSAAHRRRIAVASLQPPAVRSLMSRNDLLVNRISKSPLQLTEARLPVGIPVRSHFSFRGLRSSEGDLGGELDVAVAQPLSKGTAGCPTFLASAERVF